MSHPVGAIPAAPKLQPEPAQGATSAVSTSHPAIAARGYIVSLFTRRQRLGYLLLCALWAIATIWFWQW